MANIRSRHGDLGRENSPRDNSKNARALPARAVLIDPPANDVACDDDEEAEEERNPPTPGIERFVRHVGGEWQEDRCGDDLAGLHAVQREARVEAVPAKRRMLENHRARAGDLTSYSETLDETENNEKHRRMQADSLVDWQEADRHARKAHEQHA